MTQDALDVGWLLYYSRLSDLFLQGMCRSRVLMMPRTESDPNLGFQIQTHLQLHCNRWKPWRVPVQGGFIGQFNRVVMPELKAGTKSHWFPKAGPNAMGRQWKVWWAFWDVALWWSREKVLGLGMMHILEQCSQFDSWKKGSGKVLYFLLLPYAEWTSRNFEVPRMLRHLPSCCRECRGRHHHFLGWTRWGISRLKDLKGSKQGTFSAEAFCVSCFKFWGVSSICIYRNYRYEHMFVWIQIRKAFALKSLELGMEMPCKAWGPTVRIQQHVDRCGTNFRGSMEGLIDSTNQWTVGYETSSSICNYIQKEHLFAWMQAQGTESTRCWQSVPALDFEKP